MSIELTVIVKDSDGNLFEGAEVNVTPGNFKAETGSNGEAVISIDGADRYQVEVEAGDVQQIVPFYPAQGQYEARLEVNLQYFEQLEKTEKGTTENREVQEVSAPWYQVSHEQSGYLLAAVIVVLAVAVVAMRSARKKREKVEVKTSDETNDKVSSPPKKAKKPTKKKAK